MPEHTKINIGCFDNSVAGWLNLDATPHALVARVPGLFYLLKFTGLISARAFDSHKRGAFRRVHYCNVVKRIPVQQGSAEFIYCEHFLEHLYFDQALRYLRNCHSALKVGGRIRVAVPDLDQLVENYRAEKANDFCAKVFETSTVSKNQHHWMYSFRSLGSLLTEAGFTGITRMQYRQGEMPELEKLELRHDSLIIEGRKE